MQHSHSCCTMAFLKTIWKSHKHKKLSDDWDQEKDIEMDEPGSTMEGITFNVKYLGTCPISSASNAKLTAEAVKNIVSKSKSLNVKPVMVQFAINLRGVSVRDLETRETLIDVSLYRMSYCSADATYSHVFAFISTDDQDNLYCHAFFCPKRKMAQLMSITVAQTFNTAYHLWQITHRSSAMPTHKDTHTDSLLAGCIGSREEKRPSVIQQVLAPIPMLIDLTTPFEGSPAHRQWASFED